MEKKNSFKKIIILFCVATFLIIITAISIFLTMNNKNVDKNTINNSLNENSISNSSINFEQSKQTNIIVNEVVSLDSSSYSKTENIVEVDLYKNVKGDDDAIITESNIIKDIDNITDEKLEDIVKKTLTEYAEIARYENSNIGPMPGIILTLNLAEGYENENYSYGGPQTYIITNISYSNFKNALLQYVTEEYFIKNFSQYKNIDGKFSCADCAGGNPGVEIGKVELKYKEDNNFVFELTSIDTEIYSLYEQGENYTEEDYLLKCKVEFKYENDRLVISKYGN